RGTPPASAPVATTHDALATSGVLVGLTRPTRVAREGAVIEAAPNRASPRRSRSPNPAGTRAAPAGGANKPPDGSIPLPPPAAPPPPPTPLPPAPPGCDFGVSLSKREANGSANHGCDQSASGATGAFDAAAAGLACGAARRDRPPALTFRKATPAR